MRLMNRIAVLAASASFLAGGTATAQSRYVIHDNPWGESASIAANWNQAFGANWNYTGYSSANAATIFSASTRLVWLEGGDATANTFSGFLNTNRATIETWVSNGGRLVLNAAPNQGGNINYGFGGLTLNYTGASSGSGTAVAANAAHPIFTGPFGPVGTSFTGNSFSHAFVTGAGLGGILLDDLGRIVLGERSFGSGRVLAGGMTTDNWHEPTPEAQNLSANILAYADNGAAVPEPASAILMVIGLIAMGVAARGRRGVTAA